MNFFNVALYSFIAGLSTIVGAQLVHKYGEWTKRNSLYLISFAVGVLIANAFLHLLPEAMELSPKYALIAVVSGIMMLFLVEHFITLHVCREETCDIHTVGYTGAIGIGIHSLIDGVVIGIGFEASFALGVLTSLAVIMHEVPEGVFSYTLLRYDEIPERKALIYTWIVALATPFGAITTFLLIRNVSANLLGVLLGIAAGSFVYVGSSDLMPHAHKKPNIINAVLVFLGIFFVVIISRLLESV